jgi:PAS domain S-box-containing protein
MVGFRLEKIVSEKENLERILETLSEGIIAHDRNRRIIFFNRSAEEITGYQRQEVIGKDCHEVFGGPFCGGRCSFLEGSPDSLDRLSYPLNILNKKGEARRIEMQVTGMKDGGDGFIGVVAAFRDVTDLIGLKIQAGDLKGFAGIIGRHPKMLHVYRQIRDLATTDYPVHISGETGTGKELVASAIHNESRRGGRPFVPINCGALPEGVLESELFGHVKGAFTGAVRDKRGRFELAHSGTVFLDEVADLPKPVQAKLLRVLQEGTFERVGGEQTVSVDIRIISATNRDLKQEVRMKSFREDLYYRISVVPIHLPPLRERKEDIPLLAEHFLRKAAEEGQEVLGVSAETLEIMKAYTWPGNVRELQSAVHYALVHCRGEIIKPEHLPLELRNWKGSASNRRTSTKLTEDTVRHALTQAGGNKAKASRILGVGRATLYRFISDHQGVS